uniref:Retrotransposon gag domain-containing protein n=1 Tax=Fagus sylvatica TaxID=28930 RepID=A0A2N9G096_FAGSY
MGLPSVWVCCAWVHREFAVPGLAVGLPCLGSWVWVAVGWVAVGLPWVLCSGSQWVTRWVMVGFCGGLARSGSGWVAGVSWWVWGGVAHGGGATHGSPVADTKVAVAACAPPRPPLPRPPLLLVLDAETLVLARRESEAVNGSSAGIPLCGFIPRCRALREPEICDGQSLEECPVWWQYMQALCLASPSLELLCWTLLEEALDPRPLAGEHIKYMAPPRKNSRNGLPSTEGTTDILQTIIQAIGGLTEVVQHQVGATNPMSSLEKFRKLDPPSFKGSKDPLEADNWLKELERLFKAMNVRDEQQVTLAVFVLKGDTLEWWESTERTHEGGVVSWQQFVDLFRKRYFPDSLRLQKEAEFICIEQGNQLVYEYEHKFAELSHFAPQMVDIEHALNVARLDISSRIVQSSKMSRQTANGNQQKPKVPGRVFALTKQDAETSPSVVSGTLVITNQHAQVLFDSGSTHSFISHGFAWRLNMIPETLDFELCVDTPSGHVMCTDKVYKSCNVLVSRRELEANLVLLDMYEFDVILGMDWLSIFHASIDCFGKKVVFRIPG